MTITNHSKKLSIFVTYINFLKHKLSKVESFQLFQKTKISTEFIVNEFLMNGGSPPKAGASPPSNKAKPELGGNNKNNNDYNEQDNGSLNPILVFGSMNNVLDAETKGEQNKEEEDEYGCGIELCAHQPTFLNLDSLVPRGYSSLLDLPQATIETPSLIGQNQEIPLKQQSQSQVLPSESLSQMKLRNKDKWSEIGYDPNSGKGNLKCSYTLSQFRPSALIGNLNTKNDKKETISTITEEDESKTSRSNDNNKPENKKSQGRINSSEGKRKKYAMSDSDEEEKKEEEEKEEDNPKEQQPFGDISMLLAQPLIADNEMIEEEEEEEEADVEEININNPVLVFGSMNNIHEIKETEDQATTEEDEYGCGIELCAHQPTFLNLDSLVPRGYSSLLDLPQATIETPSLIGQNQEIPLKQQSQSQVLPSESLSQMKLRNKDKWSEIGYDPNSGKGNLKCSYTLSQFRPSALIGNLNTKNDKKETISTITEEDESKTSRSNDNNKPENKKSQGRINSSEGKRKKYAMSDSDEEEKKEEEEKEEDNPKEQQPFGDISMLLAQPLIADNEMIEEEEEEEEADVEEININQANTQDIKQEVGPNNSESKENDNTINNTEEKKKEKQPKATNKKIETSRKHNEQHSKNTHEKQIDNDKGKTKQNNKTNQKGDESQTNQAKSNKNNTTYNERYNMFLTQIQEQKIQKTSKSDDDDFAQKKTNNDEKSKELFKTYKVDNPYVKKDKARQRSASSIASHNYKFYQPFPTYQPKPPLDLTPYDDENFDADKEKSKIPPRLLEIIHHSSQSIVFRALCGEDISSNPMKVLNQVISDLKEYLNKCVKMNMIGESSYVDCIINNIKVDVQNLNKTSKKKDDDIDQKIDQAEVFFEDRKQRYVYFNILF